MGHAYMRVICTGSTVAIACATATPLHDKSTTVTAGLRWLSKPKKSVIGLCLVPLSASAGRRDERSGRSHWLKSLSAWRDAAALIVQDANSTVAFDQGSQPSDAVIAARCAWGDNMCGGEDTTAVSYPRRCSRRIACARAADLTGVSGTDCATRAKPAKPGYTVYGQWRHRMLRPTFTDRVC